MKNKLSLQKLSDAELLKMVAETNSSDAMEALMHGHKEAIENIGYRFLKRKVLREDLHQEVAERVIRRLRDGSYVETGHFPQWVHTLAYRIAERIAKEEKYRRYYENEYEHAMEYIPMPDPADHHEYDINVMLNYLSRGQRKVISKRLLEQKTIKETAEELDMTEGGVRSVCSKALRRWNKSGFVKASAAIAKKIFL